MSIHGVLEDLPLADVLQFIHLGQRTGTLYLWREGEGRAEIGFHVGRIVSAWTPGHKRLGDLLVVGGVITQAAIDEALQRQKGAAEAGRSIGQILLEEELVTRADIHQVLKEQIKETVFDLVTWRSGNFHFEVDELNPVDDFSIVPVEILANFDMNTQMLLLEATRIYDERSRSTSAAEEESALDQHLERAGLASRSDRRHDKQDTQPLPVPPSESSFEAVRCQVVSEDMELVRALRSHLPPELGRVVSVRIREAGNRLPGETSPPLVVLDLRATTVGDDAIATLRRTRPAASIIALVETLEQGGEAYEAGAIAVALPRGELLAHCCANVIRMISHPQPQGTFVAGRQGGFSRFRQVVSDIQSGLHSATMALNLMQLISESVERAVLLLLRGQEMVGVGAFGFSNQNESLASVTRGLKIDPPPASALRRAVIESKTQSLDFDDAKLPADFASILGRPASGQVVVFPVMGAERPIAVLYTDNGALDRGIADIKILELATAQVGVAFENELLQARKPASLRFGSDDEFGSLKNLAT